MEIIPVVLFLVANVGNAFGSGHSKAGESRFNAMMKSEDKLCAADRPPVTKTGVSLIRCTTRCASLTSCAHFNYRNNEETCNLFQFTPGCYSLTPICTHYQASYNFIEFLRYVFMCILSCIVCQCFLPNVFNLPICQLHLSGLPIYSI